jgi:hypothetical protein
MLAKPGACPRPPDDLAPVIAMPVTAGDAGGLARIPAKKRRKHTIHF